MYDLATKYEIVLQQHIEIDETGFDFRVGIGADQNGVRWVLRVPRRADALEKAKQEQKTLRLVQSHLNVATPDWRVFSPELIAYPLIHGKQAFRMDHTTQQRTWNIADVAKYDEQFARVLAEIHAVPLVDATRSGVPTNSDPRATLRSEIALIKTKINVHLSHLTAWTGWIEDDSLWPDFATFVHGDIHQAHHIMNEAGDIAGIIDWTEARIDDPATDFIFHYKAFGEDRLRGLLAHYEKCGGRLWPKVVEHTKARAEAFNIVLAVYAIKTANDDLMKQAVTILEAPALYLSTNNIK